jgi:hypothetical protein
MQSLGPGYGMLPQLAMLPNIAQFDVRDSRKRIWTDADDELLVYLKRESQLNWNQVLVYFKHSSVKDLKARLSEFEFKQLNAIARSLHRALCIMVKCVVKSNIF